MSQTTRDSDNLPPSRKRTGFPLENVRQKEPRTDRRHLFDPKFFTKGNQYDGIYDSSDSDSEEELPLAASGIKERAKTTCEKLNTELVQEEISSEEELPEEVSSEEELPEEELLEEEISSEDELPEEELLEEEISSEEEPPEERSDKKNNTWMKGLSVEEIGVLEPKLNQLRRNIKDNAPTIVKILRSGLPDSEKERALQLYDSLSDMGQNTSEHVVLSTRISEMIRSAPNVANLETDGELMRLKAIMEVNNPTIEKIVNAHLTQSDKIRALELYAGLQRTDFNTETWFSTQRRINSMIDAQLESEEAVLQAEREEASLKDSVIDFNTSLKRKIFNLDADQLTKSRIYDMYSDMISRSTSDSKYGDLRDKILWCVKLPYRYSVPSSLVDKTPAAINQYCRQIYQRLDADLYGMKEAKEKIL